MHQTTLSQIKKVIILGPTRETLTIGNAMSSIANRQLQVEKILTVVPLSGIKLDRSELLPILKEKLKGSDSSTLVISDIGETRPYKFEQIAADVKENSNNAAVVLLTSKPECVGKEENLKSLVASRGFEPDKVISQIDYIFQYTGVSGLFPMMAAVHESKLNYMSDHERSILVFESRPNYYTGYLTELYNFSKDRTRLLLARNYDEAVEIINGVKQRFAGAILGMRYPGDSFRLMKMLRMYNKGVPVIMQSSKPERLDMARKDPSVFTLDKNDLNLFRSLGEIIRDYFGFGDFIFRTSAGVEIGRARDLAELCSLIGSLDGGILLGHAARNDFSNWLYLHGYKNAAEAIKPVYTDDSELLRSMLLSDLLPHLK